MHGWADLTWPSGEDFLQLDSTGTAVREQKEGSVLREMSLAKEVKA
jgi:hypothetical protein